MTELSALRFAVRGLCGSASPKGLGQLQEMVGTADGRAGVPQPRSCGGSLPAQQSIGEVVERSTKTQWGQRNGLTCCLHCGCARKKG